MIPGSWHATLAVALIIGVVAGFVVLLRRRPDHRPRIRVGLDARHGYAPRSDERDSIALFRRIHEQQRARVGV